MLSEAASWPVSIQHMHAAAECAPAETAALAGIVHAGSTAVALEAYLVSCCTCRCQQRRNDRVPLHCRSGMRSSSTGCTMRLPRRAPRARSPPLTPATPSTTRAPSALRTCASTSATLACPPRSPRCAFCAVSSPYFWDHACYCTCSHRVLQVQPWVESISGAFMSSYLTVIRCKH